MKRKQAVKKVWKGIALVLIFAAAAIPAVFMNSVYGYFAILFLAILVIFSGLTLLILKGRIRIDAGGGDRSCLRGQPVNIGLKLVNTSRLICADANASLVISDLFGESDARRNVRFTLAGRDSMDLGFGMDMTHVGVYNVGLDRVELHDYLGIFRSIVSVNGIFQVAVLPRTRWMEEFHVSEAMTETSRETRVTTPGGMDYTGVREYVPGDPMKQIHWKLSAHSRGYLTKLQEVNRQQEYMIVLDFAAEQKEDREELMDINDCLIETALSAGEQISRTDCMCRLVYVNRSGQITETTNLRESGYAELIQSFCFIKPGPPAEFPDGAEILEECATRNGSSNIIVVTSRITEELLNSLNRIKAQRRIPELFVVIPAEWNSRQIEALAARLQQLDEAGIHFQIISTSVNLEQ